MHKNQLNIPEITGSNTDISVSLTSPENISGQEIFRLIVICWGPSFGRFRDSLITKLVQNLQFSCLEIQLDPGHNDTSSIVDRAYKHLARTGQYVLAGLIGFTDGVSTLFQWAISNQDQLTIPTIINLSGSEKSTGKGNQLPESDIIPESEGSQLIKTLEQLDRQTGVLSIYGVDDANVTKSAIYANCLAGRHRLVLVPDADYSLNQPNYDFISVISDWFAADSERERFMQYHRHSGVITRWKDIEGVQNFRDFGGFKTKKSGINIRPGLLFRSAALSGITDRGKTDLAHLGIKTIFDLRSDHEVDIKPCPDIPGVEIRRVPVYKNMDLDPEALARRYSNYSDSQQGFQRAYREIIVKGGPGPYRQILQHIRDRPGDAILIHCTAGKDRTGVICAIILLLLQVDKDIVAREYELTTYGLRNEIQNILDTLATDKENWAENGDKFARMLSSTYDTMLGFIHVLNSEFGGAENYIRQHTGLNDKDINRIKHNLTAENGRGWKWVHSQL